MASSLSPVSPCGPIDAMQIEIDRRLVNEDFKETELFPAVRMNDVTLITDLVKKGADINAVDRFQRNALQSALQACCLKVEACRALVQLGIDVDHKDDLDRVALGHIVYFYKEPCLMESEERLRDRLELFRCLVEGGADVGGVYKHDGYTDIREKIKSHPEMEAIVQEVKAQKANEISAGSRSHFP